MGLCAVLFKYSMYTVKGFKLSLIQSLSAMLQTGELSILSNL